MPKNQGKTLLSTLGIYPEKKNRNWLLDKSWWTTLHVEGLEIRHIPFYVNCLQLLMLEGFLDILGGSQKLGLYSIHPSLKEGLRSANVFDLLDESCLNICVTTSAVQNREYILFADPTLRLPIDNDWQYLCGQNFKYNSSHFRKHSFIQCKY
jgi:hypothetical protein